MKKIALIALCLMIVTGAVAQKKNVTTSLIELNKSEPDMDKVLTYLTEAAQDPSTKDYHKTWYAMSKMYMKMLNMPQYKDKQPSAKATDALFRLIDIDPKYETQDVNNWLMVAASINYQQAAGAFQQKNYTTSAELAKKVIEIHDLEGGKRFGGNKLFDTTAAAAEQIVAYSYYNAKDYPNAISALEKFITNPIYSNAGSYAMLADAYKQTGDNDKTIAAIDKGRAAYPNDKQLRIEEINYYIATGQQEVFIKKLQDAVAADPNNAELHFFLAQSYSDLASPVDKDGKALDKPANAEELMNNAEESYTKAVSLNPDNITYLYNFAAFYFNQSVPLNLEIKGLGTTAADDKRYEELNDLVKEYYAKAMPNFQKVYDILEPKHATLSTEDKSTLVNTIMAMREIHARNNNAAESKALKAKLDEVTGK